MSPRKDWAMLYENGLIAFSEVPVEWHTNIYKRAYAYLGLNRDAQKMTLTRLGTFDVKENPMPHAPTLHNLNWAMNALRELGYTFADTNRYVGESYWLKIRQSPVNGTLAIIGCSHKYAYTADHIIMVINMPEGNPNNYAEPFGTRVYVNAKRGVWYVGYTTNPLVDSDPSFNVWDEPFHGVKQLTGTLDQSGIR